MKLPALFAAGAGTGVVLTLGGMTISNLTAPQAPAAAAGIVTAPTATGGTSTGSTHVGVTPSHSGASQSGASQSQAAPTTLTINGTAASTQYGTVQVRITLTGHHIVSVSALTLPSGGRSSGISSYAAPILQQETMSAQSANISSVSGASYTSEGWRESLQGALDVAHAHGL